MGHVKARSHSQFEGDVYKRQVFCRCRAFTSEKVEFIPAYEVVESQKNKNDVSLYDGYIETCAQNGIDREIMQRFMD